MMGTTNGSQLHLVLLLGSVPARKSVGSPEVLLPSASSEHSASSDGTFHPIQEPIERLLVTGSGLHGPVRVPRPPVVPPPLARPAHWSPSPFVVPVEPAGRL